MSAAAVAPTRRQLLGAAMGLAGLPLGARPAWRVMGPDRYAPLLYLKDGVPSGPLADRLSAAGRHSGDRFNLELMAWSRALALARRGEGGLLGVSRTPERETWLDFSQPLFFDDLVLVVRRGHAFPFRRLEDLRGKVLGMARGTTGGTAFDAFEAAGHLRVERDSSAPQRLLALRAGRIDAAVMGGDHWALDRALAEHPLLTDPPAQFELLPTPLLRDALHLAFPKVLQARAVLNRVDEALRELGPPPTGATQPR